MIYVSSFSSKQKRIGHAIEELVEAGIRNIELSGGTEYYVGYEDEECQIVNKEHEQCVSYLVSFYKVLNVIYGNYVVKAN